MVGDGSPCCSATTHRPPTLTTPKGSPLMGLQNMLAAYARCSGVVENHAPTWVRQRTPPHPPWPSTAATSSQSKPSTAPCSPLMGRPGRVTAWRRTAPLLMQPGRRAGNLRAVGRRCCSAKMRSSTKPPRCFHPLMMCCHGILPVLKGDAPLMRYWAGHQCAIQNRQ